MKRLKRLLVCMTLLLLIAGCARNAAAPLPAPLPEAAPAPAPAATVFADDANAHEREPRVRLRPLELNRPVPQAAAQKPVIHEPRPVEAPAQVPVLLYHDLAPGARGGNGGTIDVAEFEQQMAWLARNGYTAVTSAELLAWLHGKGKLPAKPVHIHFDDGYLSNYVTALPIMKKHGMRGVLFLVSSFPDDQSLKGIVSWKQARTMAESGVFEIQGHTHHGHDKTDGVANLVAWKNQQIRDDYRRMKEQFAAAGLPAPFTLAYPYGAHDDETVAALRAEGVKAAFTVEHGYVRRGDDLHRLRRLIVWPGLSECQFAGLVRGQAVCPATI